jgi:DNA helicase II / ATP-dependent DNA helicase PcrA
MPSQNRIIIAAAGSGKTTMLVDAALRCPDHRVLIVTYTNNNCAEIRSKVIERCGYVPAQLQIRTWFDFLLAECVRPYQRSIYDGPRVSEMFQVDGNPPKYARKADVRRYYFSSGLRMYSNKVAEFSIDCDDACGGLVIDRLQRIYSKILIDEVQDLSGYDLVLVERLLGSSTQVTAVGDIRQAVLRTHFSNKHKKYRGSNVIDLFKDWKDLALCEIEYVTDCHRSNQAICDLADSVFPDIPKTTSRRGGNHHHAGLFQVKVNDLDSYVEKVGPQILRHNRRADAGGHPALNFGRSKGLAFPHVLIVPTNPMRKALKTGTLHEMTSKSSLYVAITRAEHSVAFLMDEEIAVPGFARFRPDDSANSEKGVCISSRTLNRYGFLDCPGCGNALFKSYRYCPFGCGRIHIEP